MGVSEMDASFRDIEAPARVLREDRQSPDIGYENGPSRKHSAVTHEPSLTLARPLPAERHPASVYLSGLAPGSYRTMRQALDTIAALLTGGVADADLVDWSKVRYAHAKVVRARLKKSYAPATVNKTISAFRGVLREAWRLGQMSAEDFHRATDLKAVKRETLPRGRALGAGELAALMRVCCADSSPAGARDAALIGVLYACGLRRSEAVALDVSDLDPETGALTIRSAKGNKDRLVYATNGAADALADWLSLRGSHAGPMFNPVNKGGRIIDRKVTGQAVMAALAKRARQAGVAHVSPHDLRRSFVSDLLDAGADITTVSKLAGHAGVGTTMRYDMRGEKTKRRAAALLHVPYQPREG
jgi:site-specific recombinase XerD